MLISLISFIYILFLSLIYGTFVIKCINSLYKCETKSPLLITLSGLMFLNVYSQFFSLFYKVDILANIILIVGAISLIAQKNIRKILTNSINLVKKSYKGLTISVILKISATLLIILAMLAIASSQETFYDTELYHAQAIRWIEEYGIVKGLGLLHSRFAYNSAFMALQALFGLSDILGTELHGVNAFICMIIMIANINTLSFLDNKISQNANHPMILPSDMLKCGYFAFVAFIQLDSLSSPNSDFFALSLVFVIITNALEHFENIRFCQNHSDTEKNCNNSIGYFLILSLLSVYAVTLKLSVALIILVAIYPTYLMIKSHNTKGIIIAVLFGLIIVSPWMIRSVIISGYLVYPYSSIDLFNVDYKMNKELVEYDSNEIIAWGKGLKDATKADAPISEWLPIWWNAASSGWKLFLKSTFILHILAAVKCAIDLFSIIKFRLSDKNHETNDCSGQFRYKFALLTIYSLCGILILMWISTSPLLRYGGAILLLIPSIFIGDIVGSLSDKEIMQRILKRNFNISSSVFYKTISMLGILAGSITLLICSGKIAYYISYTPTKVITPIPYKDFEVNEFSFDNGVKLYYAVEGTDMTGYNHFPSTPYEPSTEYIKLRSDSLKDGFTLPQ